MSAKSSQSNFGHLGHKLGIIGGGQLARMMAMEGAKLGFEIHVLCENADDPAAQVVRHWHHGDLNDPKSLSDFFSVVHHVTFESEFLDETAIQSALQKRNAGIDIVLSPPLSIIGTLSDRLTQKTWLKKNRIPTSTFIGLTSLDLLKMFFKESPTGIVLKKRRFGYDGYGTFIIRSQYELTEWIQNHSSDFEAYIVEKFIPFKRELAIQIAISTDGSYTIFPIVEWFAENSKCLWVKGPITSRSTQKLIPNIVRALKKSQYVGLVAFEFFDTGKGILVNEVAPRVHNSGHYTLDAVVPNQFQAHLLAISGHKLNQKPKLTARAFAMLNLLGTKVQKATGYIPHQDGASLHWYGKTEFRPGRKMGHITASAANPAAALQKILKLKNRWLKQ